MPLLIYAAGPSLRHIFSKVTRQICSLRVRDLQPVAPSDRLNRPLLRQAPDVAGKLRDLAHHGPAVIEDHDAQKFFLVRPYIAPERGRPTPAPEESFHVGIFFEVVLDTLPDVFSVEFFLRLPQAVWHVSFGWIKRVVQIRTPFFEPFLRRLRVRKALFDPLSCFHVSLL